MHFHWTIHFFWTAVCCCSIYLWNTWHHDAWCITKEVCVFPPSKGSHCWLAKSLASVASRQQELPSSTICGCYNLHIMLYQAFQMRTVFSVTKNYNLKEWWNMHSARWKHFSCLCLKSGAGVVSHLAKDRLSETNCQLVFDLHKYTSARLCKRLYSVLRFISRQAEHEMTQHLEAFLQ